MTDKEKDLLLKDLSARLTYGVKAKYYGAEEECECVDIIEGIYPFDNEIIIGQYGLKVEAIKPYLFPLSSMTERQKKEYYLICSLSKLDADENEAAASLVDWCHKNHLDWRGLIPIGLAIDATGLNIY